ncbi:MutS-related protein [Anoxynatronum sibiricum]|uniref:MutS-like protein n=1 Tax=Anoxynatronum sibiricum TaxID=210623 RepID=A0ABU9VUZ1_9CLOT
MTFFLNDSIPETIGLTETLARLPLETEYGRLAKEALSPFSREEALQLEESWREIGLYLEADMANPDLLKSLRQHLHGLPNLRKSLLLAARGDRLTDIELFEIKKQAFATERIRKVLQHNRKLLVPSVELAPVHWLIDLLDPEGTGIETFYVYDCYDDELKHIRQEKNRLEESLRRQTKLREQQAVEVTGMRPLWNGEFLISATHIEGIDCLESLGTYEKTGETGGEWIYRQRRLPEAEQTEALLMMEDEAENRVRQRLSESIGEAQELLMANTFALAQMDLLLGKVVLARRYRSCCPVLTDEAAICITGGRHPVLEEALRRQRRQPTAVDIEMNRGVTVITGANMGGKTMTLKMAALLTTLAQMGFWVPADHFAFQPVDWLYFSTGDQQSQSMGLSTFGAEIYALKEVLERTHESGLLLLDELASGTNPLEGTCISRAIVAHLSQSKAISVVTTHYDGVGDLPGVRHLQVLGLNRATLQKLKHQVQETGWSSGLFEAAMDYRLQPREPGVPVPKDAIAVASLMGLQPDILEAAQRWLCLHREATVENPVNGEREESE